MKILFVKSAEKELLHLNKSLGQRIFQKISLLINDPYNQNSQKLEGNKGYRMRIGDYGVVYTIDKENQTILIIKIGNRREIYKQ